MDTAGGDFGRQSSLPPRQGGAPKEEALRSESDYPPEEKISQPFRPRFLTS